MGKSLKGRLLGEGITQRKDGIYIGRFTDRWGKRRTVSSKTLADCKKKLMESIDADKKRMNVIDDDITVDQWFENWISVYKKNCRANTITTYTNHYNRIREKIGFVKLSQLTSFMLQDALNSLRSDNERYNTKKIISEMLEKAFVSDLVIKNVAKSVNTRISIVDERGNLVTDVKKEIKTLSKEEEKIFLEYASGTVYYNLFIVALQTGMRIGELTGLMWEDVDFHTHVIHVQRSLTYFSKNGKYCYEIHPTKTRSGIRDIPMTPTCAAALKKQKEFINELKDAGKQSEAGFDDLIFVTQNYHPTSEFLVTQCMRRIIARINKESVGIAFFAPHTFCHTFATNALDAGMRPKTLQRILGHKTLQMTMDLYCSVPEDTVNAEMRLFGEAHSINL